MWVLFLGLLVLFEGVADIFSKEWSLSGRWKHWILAMLAYVVANTFWLIAIRSGSGLARGATIFSVISALVGVGLGVLWYKEILSSIQLVGVVLGILSIVFILWPELVLLARGEY